MKYVLSTMTSNCAYTLWNRIGDLPVPGRKIRIFGGAGLPSATSGVGEIGRDLEGKPLWTPSGVVTQVEDEAAEVLKNHPIFKKHLEAGYVKFLDHDISGSQKQIDKAVQSMNRDGFQQHTKDSIKNVKVTLGHNNDDNDYRV